MGFWISLLDDALGVGNSTSGSSGLISKAASSALGNSAIPAASNTASNLIGLPAAGGAPAATSSPFSQLAGNAVNKVQPLINDVKTDWSGLTSGASAGQDIMNLANTVSAAHSLKNGGGQGMLQGGQQGQQTTMPQLNPSLHLNPPNEQGIQTFNDAGTKYLNDAITPQRFNGYPTLGQQSTQSN